MPSVGTLQYLWMTVAKKSAAGALLQNWSTPVRTNGVPGEKGATGATGEPGAAGEPGPGVVFRGVYSSSATYYGTSKRVDVVQYNSTYYVARTDAGNGFSGRTPTNTSYWNSFGAQFESVATGLLLAELAYIENLIVGRLSTGKDDSLPRLFAKGSELGFYLNKAAESNAINALVRIGMDVGEMQALGSNRPGIIARAINGDGKYSELTSAGLFANGGNVTGIPATAGISNAFSVAALLQSRVAGSYGSPSINAAVYGYDTSATNYNDPNNIPALGFGGYFNKLCANGMFFNCRRLTQSNTTAERVIKESDVFITMYNTSQTTIYLFLPQTAGQIIFVRLNYNSNVIINAANYSFNKQILLPSGSAVYENTATTQGELITLFWDGSYWLWNTSVQ
jgi:hypothetical protein